MNSILYEQKIVNFQILQSFLSKKEYRDIIVNKITEQYALKSQIEDGEVLNVLKKAILENYEKQKEIYLELLEKKTQIQLLNIKYNSLPEERSFFKDSLYNRITDLKNKILNLDLTFLGVEGLNLDEIEELLNEVEPTQLKKLRSLNSNDLRMAEKLELMKDNTHGQMFEEFASKLTRNSLKTINNSFFKTTLEKILEKMEEEEKDELKIDLELEGPKSLNELEEDDTIIDLFTKIIKTTLGKSTNIIKGSTI